MSTRIYDAYRLPDRANVLLATRELAPAITAATRPLALSAIGLAGILMYSSRDQDRTTQVTKAVTALKGHARTELVDVQRALFPGQIGDEFTGPLALATAVVQAVNTSDEHARVLPVADLRFAVTWMVDPVTNGSQGHDQYARVFTERDSLRQTFLDVTGASDFHYQDCGDRPHDVPEDRWEARRDVWRRLMPDGQPPAALAPSWDNSLDLEGLWLAAATGEWLTAQAVCDQLQADGIPKDEGRATFEERLTG